MNKHIIVPSPYQTNRIPVDPPPEFGVVVSQARYYSAGIAVMRLGIYGCEAVGASLCGFGCVGVGA